MQRTAYFILFAWYTVSCLTGCLSPLNTRLPQVMPRHTKIEKRLYERHDPFDDEALGPKLFVRPRGFTTPRDPARRAAEQEALRGLNLERAPATSGAPVSQYPAVVNQ